MAVQYFLIRSNSRLAVQAVSQVQSPGLGPSEALSLSAPASRRPFRSRRVSLRSRGSSVPECPRERLGSRGGFRRRALRR